jgi:putative sterol carrier protein
MATVAELMDLAKRKIAEDTGQAATVGAVYKFVLDGEGGGTYVINLKDDPGVTEGDGAAQCTIKMSAKDYVDMVEGRVSGQRLFFTGRMKIKGDMRLAMKLEEFTSAMKA